MKGTLTMTSQGTPNGNGARQPTRAHHYMADGQSSPLWLAVTAQTMTDVGRERRRFEARDGSAIIATPTRQGLGVHRDKLEAARERYSFGALILGAFVEDGHGLTADDALPA